ncbi:acetylxylan esterase [Colwellia sp. 6_MG-2023]|uniref:acetylxylan esterase n=1 Tax=Colwellia sp. 6_MG-2023 TaxID=3062676 RepID=UPI0026E42E07|nr:acetylxylan esterase [Colwellia sp. 6_MG-2023]MDO6489638.1 acetylxylan esterase [Colwellia sp. 6_MG-2023]
MKFTQFLISGLMLILLPVKAVTVIDKLHSLALSDKAPIVYDQQTLNDGFQSLYFDGAMYQGKQTRIFAYYKAPKGKGPFPAVVLVHGGGGSAFKEWITQWNEAGFAAISIATEGQTGTLTGKKQPKWVKHEWGGPRRPGIYNDPNKPLNDQWMNQSVTAAIQAHNLIRSFDEINQEQIGLSGISWGGVITSTVIGFDQRFAFAIPIYGCGFLDNMKNKYGKALANNESYKNVWEPALRIHKFKNPTFWMTGLKENNFSLDAQANTYKLLPGKHYQSIQPKLKHSHKYGWAPKEPYIFGQAVINNKPTPYFYEPIISDSSASVKLSITNNKVSDIEEAILFYTVDTGHTLDRKWHQLAVTMEVLKNEVLLHSSLPKDATAWVFNINYMGLTYTSEFAERIK